MSLFPTEKEILESKLKELLIAHETLQTGMQAIGKMIKEKDQCIHDLKTALLYAGDRISELETEKNALVEEIQNLHKGV